MIKTEKKILWGVNVVYILNVVEVDFFVPINLEKIKANIDVHFNLLYCLSTSRIKNLLKVLYQLTFTCSNSTIETLEKGVKYVQS